jgi:hypothetical protein
VANHKTCIKSIFCLTSHSARRLFNLKNWREVASLPDRVSSIWCQWLIAKPRALTEVQELNQALEIMLLHVSDDAWWLWPGYTGRRLSPAARATDESLRLWGQNSETADPWVFEYIVVFAIEHIELPAKLLDYFLRSNKGNINQLYESCQTGMQNLWYSSNVDHLPRYYVLKWIWDGNDRDRLFWFRIIHTHWWFQFQFTVTLPSWKNTCIYIYIRMCHRDK